MPLVLAGCPQPKPVNGKPRAYLTGDYCLCKVYAQARKDCIERGEGWRWGAS